MEVYFALPDKPVMSKETKSRTSGERIVSRRLARPIPVQSKRHYRADGRPARGHGITRAKSEDCKIRESHHARRGPRDMRAYHQGRPLDFSSTSPFTFQQDDIEFEGSVGLAKIHGDDASLTLPSPGRLRVKSKVLAK